MIVDDRFFPLLSKYDPNSLDRQTDAIYGLWPDATIAFLNQGWFRFAKDNNALDIERWSLGASIFTAIPNSLIPFYKTRYSQVLREGGVWEHVYECSSPEMFRLFHMLTYPIAAEGLLVINSLRNEMPHDRPVSQLPLSEYQDSHGLIRQCAHCRRVRRVGLEETWDWIPQFVRSPSRTISHGLCFACLTYCYKLNRGEFPALLSTIDVTHSPTSDDNNR